MDVLQHLLQSAPAPKDDEITDLDSCLTRLAECPYESPFDRALWAGSVTDRLGYAFIGGYRAALSRLLPTIDPKTRLSLAATEKGGGHPKAIETSLSDTNQLSGEKTFATLASVADEIIVVATRGSKDGRNDLVLVRVETKAAGVLIEDRAPTPFAPEIPHAKVKLSNVEVSPAAILPGDGYTDYLKPFRTIEDTHVLAAALGHVIRIARTFDFDPSLLEVAFAQVLSLREVAALPPSSALAHVALSGLFQATRKLIADHEPEWQTKCGVDLRDRWQRDLGLLLVAESVRQKRTEAAWKSLAETSSK